MDRDRENDGLLGRLRAREPQALPELVDRHAQRIAAVVRDTWQGVPDSELEEVVADVVADAWFRAAEVDLARASFETWLGMRARFRTLDRLRLRRRDRGLVVRLVRARSADHSHPEYSSDLDAYLAGLSELERQLVWLRFVEGRAVIQVAELCGLTPKAVERRLARLRDRLRERCGPEPTVEAEGHA